MEKRRADIKMVICGSEGGRGSKEIEPKKGKLNAEGGKERREGRGLGRRVAKEEREILRDRVELSVS